MKKITLLAAFFAVFALNAQVTVWEDSFESYDDFVFNPIGDYTQIDNDGNQTYGIQDVEFTNAGYTGTAIVFNPSMTDPVLEGNWVPRTGEKTLNMFAATSTPNGTAENDDYIITPLIDLTNATGSEFSMWAKSITDQFGLERIEVLLSTTGTNESDFTESLTGGVEEVPVDFTEYSFDLSAYDGMQVYIAIHYTGQDSFALIMDDFAATAATLSVEDQLFNGFSYFVNNNTLNLESRTPMQSVNIHNILGQQVVSQKLGNTNETVNLSGLNSGVYLATINIDGAKKTVKFAIK